MVTSIPRVEVIPLDSQGLSIKGEQNDKNIQDALSENGQQQKKDRARHTMIKVYKD